MLKAREIAGDVEITDSLLEAIARISIALGVDGHRPDITMLHTVRALATLDHTTKVEKKHLERAARLVMPHRMRRTPFEEQTFDWNVVEKAIEGV